MPVDLAELTERVRAFAEARDWGQFHNPKNLVMALAGEVGELSEVFQWLTPDQADRVMHGEMAEAVRDELADVLIYLVRLADVLGVDLLEAAEAKVTANGYRYPVEVARGSATKSTIEGGHR